MSKFAKKYQEPTREEIAACAQRIYEMEGCPQGKAMQHWLQAEAQLIAERKAEAGMSSAKPASSTAEAPKAAWIPPRRQALSNGTRASK